MNVGEDVASWLLALGALRPGDVTPARGESWTLSDAATDAFLNGVVRPPCCARPALRQKDACIFGDLARRLARQSEGACAGRLFWGVGCHPRLGPPRHSWDCFLPPAACSSQLSQISVSVFSFFLTQRLAAALPLRRRGRPAVAAAAQPPCCWDPPPSSQGVAELLALLGTLRGIAPPPLEAFKTGDSPVARLANWNSLAPLLKARAARAAPRCCTSSHRPRSLCARRSARRHPDVRPLSRSLASTWTRTPSRWSWWETPR